MLELAGGLYIISDLLQLIFYWETEGSGDCKEKDYGAVQSQVKLAVTGGHYHLPAIHVTN